MRFFRVADVAPDWEASRVSPAENGHPLYVHRQGQGRGRFDLPRQYVGLYVARQPQAAVGERFQGSADWFEERLSYRRSIDGEDLERCLVEIETGIEFIDLDDPALLDAMGWRPSDVVKRDRSKTQELALMQWLERGKHGKGGLMWWSSWCPAWTVAMAWADPISPSYPDTVVNAVEPLSATHPAVVVAASTLVRTVISAT